MILRKPYAFFIKYFRLINLIMAVLMTILMYRTFVIGHFLDKYISDYAAASNGFDLGKYINFSHFLLCVLIIILTVTVTSVMFVKNKPKKLYVFNLLVYFLLIILYAVDSSTLNIIYKQTIDIRISKALRDVNYIMLVVQTLSFIVTIVRATGFDIKQFDFAKDLQELEIDVKDNEEFEVAVEVDKNKLKRMARYNVRNFKYFYVEHKFIINIILGVIVVLGVSSTIYFKTLYSSFYKENYTFTASSLQFNVKNSYLTKTDQLGKVISSDNVLVIVKFDVRKLSESVKAYLNTGLITLDIDGTSYTQTSNYNSSLEDIGTAYVDQELDYEFTSYFLTFAIPNEKMEKEMTLKINDNVSVVKGEVGAKNIYVKLNPIDLTDKITGDEVKIGSTLSFSGSLLGDSTFLINKYEISNKFKSEYQFCYKKDKCFASSEYITPSATGSYFKTLLKIDGNLSLDENANLSSITDMYSFLNNFATIYYVEEDGLLEKHKISSQVIKPRYKKSDNNVYIEVDKKVEKASQIYFVFNVRNYTYRYVLK